MKKNSFCILTTSSVLRERSNSFKAENTRMNSHSDTNLNKFQLNETETIDLSEEANFRIELYLTFN